jgi:hypothetical protein
LKEELAVDGKHKKQSKPLREKKEEGSSKVITCCCQEEGSANS